MEESPGQHIVPETMPDVAGASHPCDPDDLAAARELMRRLVVEWTCDAAGLVPGTLRIDAHTHLGVDSDGSTLTPEELFAQMDAAAVQAALTAPLHHPQGYDEANPEVLAWARASGGRLHALHRVDPRRSDAAADARAGLDAGAAGLKLHPRAERFGMGEAALRDVLAVANEAAAPVLIHAGRGMPQLGPATLQHARDFPDATFILAHAAVSDLAWIVDASEGVDNLVFDSSWWIPTDIFTLFERVPVHRVLFATDPPYGTVQFGLVGAARVARAAGWNDDAMAALFGGNVARVLAQRGIAHGLRDDPRAANHRVREVGDERPFQRAATYMTAALPVFFGGGDPDEMLELAEHALAIPDAHELAADADVLRPAVNATRILLRGVRDDATLRRDAIDAAIHTLTHLATPTLPVSGAGALG